VAAVLKVKGAELKKAVSLTAAFAAIVPDSPEQKVVEIKHEGGVTTLSFWHGSAKIVTELETLEGTSTTKFLDLETLSSMKFSVETSFAFDEKNVLVKTGELKVTLPYMKIDDLVDISKEVATTLTLKTKSFVKALQCHAYGSHHNNEEAQRRPVRIYLEGTTLLLQSYDKQVSAFSRLGTDFLLPPDPVDFQLLPKPLLTVLDSSDADVFAIGASPQSWKVIVGKTTVYFPNLLRASKGDFTDLLGSVRVKPCYMLVFEPGALNEALTQIAPFLKLNKNEASKVSVQIVGQKQILIKTSSAKVQNVESEIPESKVQLVMSRSPASLSGKETVAFNYKYLKEFLDNLQTKTEKVSLQWWEYMNPDVPLKGKAVSVFSGSGRYIMARLLA